MRTIKHFSLSLKSCVYYHYFLDTKNLKLFPTTLKDATLKWFMGLGVYSISTWEEMKN